MNPSIDPRLNPELKAYIWQVMNDLEAFLTSESRVEIVQVPSAKIINKMKKTNELPEDFKANFCFEIVLQEGDQRIRSYGLHDDEFLALGIAKDKMVKQLSHIHNEVVTTAERVNEINSYINGSMTKH